MDPSGESSCTSFVLYINVHQQAEGHPIVVQKHHQTEQPLGTMQAVSSGAYSLSALLLTGALNPALAVGEINPGAGASVTASTPPSIPNLPAPGGITAFEGLLIFAPVILYGLFSVYRSKVNERAKVRPWPAL